MVPSKVGLLANDCESLTNAKSAFQNAEENLNFIEAEKVPSKNILDEHESEKNVSELNEIHLENIKYIADSISWDSTTATVKKCDSNIFKKLNDFPVYITVVFMTMIKRNITVISDLFCQPLNNFCKAHKNIVRVIGLTVAIILAFVQSKGNVGQHAFETQRLFSSHPFVTDYFYGELSLLREVIHQADLSCVLYYAPWDRQSQNIVPHFLKVAAYHHEQVTFAAINCWLPDSECRSTYRITRYPIVILHVRVDSFDILSIPYEGPLDSHHLIKFISNAFRPIIHVSSRAEVLALKLEYQAIVLGFYEDLNLTDDYLQFYYTSLNKLQFDHMNDVAFALITNPTLATTLSFTQSPSIHLVLYNSTLMYPNDTPRNVKNITDFLHLHISQLTKWLHINGRKSYVLDAAMREGPILLLFAPNNPYMPSNDPFRMLHSISMEYFNCQNSSLMRWLSANLRMVTKSRLKDSHQKCREYHHFHEQNLYYSYPQSLNYKYEPFCSQSLDFGKEPPFVEDSNYISEMSWNSLFTYIDRTVLSIKNFGNNCDSKTCSSYSSQNKSEHLSTQFIHKSLSSLETSQVKRGPCEDETIVRLDEWVSEDHCKRLVLGSVLDYPSFLKEEEKIVSIQGLGCETNQTLNFVAVDSLLHGDLATEMGLNLNSNIPRNTGVIIIDHYAEERYNLDQPLSANNLAFFIRNYTNGLLNRSKKSSGVDSSVHRCEAGMKCIVDINAYNYINVTQTLGKTYVVLHYSANCGACSALSHLVLMAMNATSHIDNLVFVRIDVAKNTLPWHLTFENVPTLIIYPAFRKSESRILDPSGAMTLQSLLLFISYDLDEDQRQHLAMKLCDDTCRRFVSSRTLFLAMKLQRELSNSRATYRRYVASLNRLSVLESKKSSKPQLDNYRYILRLKSIIHKNIHVSQKRLTRYWVVLNGVIKIPYIAAASQ